jgi:hypothetical protein
MRPGSATATIVSAAVLILCVQVAPALSQQPTQTSEERDERHLKPVSGTSAVVPVYRPPLRGAPAGRVGGGTRGPGREVFVLSVLAPDHAALTTLEQPTLYWFISNPSPHPIEITVVEPDKTDALVEQRLDPPIQAGVHRIRLADLGVRLEPGVSYRWYVTVVPDAKRRSRDILAGGGIELVALTDDVRTRVGGTPKERLAFVYAEAGIWYDALAEVSELIERTPGDVALRQQRAALLTQVGLPEIGEAAD